MAFRISLECDGTNVPEGYIQLTSTRVLDRFRNSSDDGYGLLFWLEAHS